MMRTSSRTTSLFIIVIALLAGMFTPASAEPKDERAAALMATDVSIPTPEFVNGLHARCGQIEDAAKQDRCHLAASNIGLEARTIKIRSGGLNTRITRFMGDFGNPVVGAVGTK